MILAVDIGTTAMKGALFGRDGKPAGEGMPSARVAIAPMPSTDPAIHEIDADSWLSALRAIVADLLGQVPAASLDALVLSGNGPTLVPVSADGRPLASAVTWLDRRAIPEALEAGRAAGRFLDPMYNLPKALWFKSHNPRLYAGTARFSSCPEFVCGTLTGEWRSFLPAEGFQKIIWDGESLRALGLDESKFPPFIGLGEIVGRTTRGAAAGFGLPAGLPVVSGGPDFIASLVGTATVSPGRACDRAGTSEGINLCHEGGFPDDPRLLLMPHVVRPYLNVSGVISTTGRAMEWFAGKSGHEEFFRQVESAPPGADRLLFLPYLAGERAPIWDPSARGAFIGLTLGHGRAHMARAVAESAAFAMRDVIETMESLGGRVRDLRATGKPASNGALNRIKADITGRPILVPEYPHAELLGDLCFARCALGDFTGPEEAAGELVSMAGACEPDPSRAGLYDELFGLYRESYDSLKNVFAGLAGARKEN